VTEGTRKIALRSAMTLSPIPAESSTASAGATPRAAGGTAAIHVVDPLARISLPRPVARDDIDGVVNIAAPNPLPNAEFADPSEACGFRSAPRASGCLRSVLPHVRKPNSF
jgi:hypothetical protein